MKRLVEYLSGWNYVQIFAFILTAAYFIALMVLMTHEATPVDGPIGKWIEIQGFNSIGDVLAGVFAPVAFLWLVVAVIIQSKELAAQREELKLTRAEFEANRVVLQKQADSADLQTRLAFSSTRANYKLALYDKRLAVYSSLVSMTSDFAVSGTPSMEEWKTLRQAFDSAKFLFGAEVTDWIKSSMDLSWNIIRKQKKIDRLNDKRQQADSMSIEEHQKHTILVDEVHSLEDALFDMVNIDTIDEKIGPYLHLPPTITIETDLIDEVEEIHKKTVRIVPTNDY